MDDNSENRKKYLLISHHTGITLRVLSSHMTELAGWTRSTLNNHEIIASIGTFLDRQYDGRGKSTSIAARKADIESQ